MSINQKCKNITCNGNIEMKLINLGVKVKYPKEVCFLRHIKKFTRKITSSPLKAVE